MAKARDGGGPSDGGGGDMEARVAKLEAHVEHIRDDITEMKSTLGTVSSQVTDLSTDMNREFRAQIRWSITTIAAVVLGFLGVIAAIVFS